MRLHAGELAPHLQTHPAVSWALALRLHALMLVIQGVALLAFGVGLVAMRK